MIKPGLFPYPLVAASSTPSHSPGSPAPRSNAGKEKCTARSHYLRIFAGAILLVLLLSVPHVSAGTTVTIDNSSSIADALLNVGSGGTLILLPGTYFISSEIGLSNSTTIKASDGYGPGDTIINARDSCRIFNNSGGYSLTVEGLTLRNGMVTGTSGGGAIYAGSGSTITLTSSRFFNCSANNGGAINIACGDTLSITGSEFVNCSGYDSGAAIYSIVTPNVTISGSGFIDCTAEFGTIYMQNIDNTVTIASSNFTSCLATNSGGAIIVTDSTARISGSTFTDCFGNLAGGVIYALSSPLNVESSTFTNCTTNGVNSYGGAIYSNEDVTVTSSTFTGCSAAFKGGAIYTGSGKVSVTSSTFTSCWVYLGGGGIHTDSGDVSVTSSTFTSCTAYNGGGGINTDSGDVSVTSSTFTGCRATDGSGGAVYRGATGPSGSVTVTDSVFEGCTASVFGGALYSDSYNVITGSTFTDCSAAVSGGAVVPYNATVTGSSFIRCTAGSGSGGAIASEGYFSGTNSTFDGCTAGLWGGAIMLSTDGTITSSTFIDCSADYGGAVCGGSLAGSSLDLHFSRIINCSSSGKAIDTFNPVFDAANNWWGTNDDPSGFVSGNATVGPWLVLGGTASPSSVTTSHTSVVRGNITFNSDGEEKSGSAHVPDGIPAAFAVTVGSGSVSPSSGTTTDGAVATTFSPSTTGVATVGITVDGVLVSVPVTVSSPSSSGSGGGSNTNTGVGASENLKAGQSAFFTFEGKGAVDGLSLTVGEDTPKIMVTVKSLSSLPSGVNEPGNVVYEYEEVTEYFVDSSGITGGQFEFRVSKSWLASNGYELGDIVMLHYNGETGVWEELETTFVKEEGGYYYYSAATPSFSWFAIAVEEGATIVSESTAAPVTKAVTAAGTSSSSSAGASVSGDGDAGVPAGSGEQGSWTSLAIPLLLVVLVIIVIAGIVIRKKKEQYPEWWDEKNLK